MEANKLELETTGINLRELLDAVHRLLVKNAEGKGLAFTVSIDPGVRIAVRGDPTRLRQVLTNLVSNAIKFTERGSVMIHVSKHKETRTQYEYLFAVRDTGIGIAPEVASKLFQAFTQADASTTRFHGGTGLGLAICQRIVKAHQGSIGVRSAPGEGAEFLVSLPGLREERPAEPRPPLTPEEKAREREARRARAEERLRGRRKRRKQQA